MSSVDKEIQQVEERLERLKQERNRLNGLPRNKKLAECIHEQFCGSNHTDACGWNYEGTEWAGSSHARFLRMADEIISTGVNDGQAIQVIKAFKRYN